MWFSKIPGYIFDKQKTPYLTEAKELTLAQSQYELAAYGVFTGSLYVIIGLAAILTFFENDSLIRLPGSMIESSNIVVPEFQLVQPLDRWSDMMDGIRFRFDNALPLNPSAPPFIFPSKYLLYNADGSVFDSLEFAQWEYVDGIYAELSYTNLSSYMRRLNFDYEIEFFSEAVGDSISVGAGTMGLPFRIVNLYTGKKVGLTCFDLGTNNNPSEGLENGVGDLSWTKGEEISFTNDTVSIAGEELAKYNFNLKWVYAVQFTNPRP